jgi:hypothetical protein
VTPYNIEFLPGTHQRKTGVLPRNASPIRYIDLGDLGRHSWSTCVPRPLFLVAPIIGSGTVEIEGTGSI